jgi:hypothetical protein
MCCSRPLSRCVPDFILPGSMRSVGFLRNQRVKRTWLSYNSHSSICHIFPTATSPFFSQYHRNFKRATLVTAATPAPPPQSQNLPIITHLKENSPIQASDAVKIIISELSQPETGASKSIITAQINRDWEGDSNLSDLMKLMKLSPFLSVSQRSNLLPKLLEQIALPQTSDPPCSLTDLCQGISGIRFFHSSNTLVLSLVSSLTSHLRSVLAAASAKRSDLNSIGLALSGLRNLKSEDPQTFSLLETLAEALNLSFHSQSDGSADPVMDLDIACRALSGLENSSSHHQPVATLVKLLANQLREPSRTGRALQLIGTSPSYHSSKVSPIVLSGKQIQLAACGLKGLSSSHSECRELIGSLAGRLQTMRGDGRLLSPLTAPAAVSLLSNLRHMDPADAVSPRLIIVCDNFSCLPFPPSGCSKTPSKNFVSFAVS